MAKVKKIGRWNVRIARRGDKYGLRNMLTWNEDEPIIEFYDTKYRGGEFGKLGQFVTRYYVTTMLEAAQRMMNNGLDMQGDVPSWKVSAVDMRRVFDFIINRIPEIKAELLSGEDAEWIRTRR